MRTSLNGHVACVTSGSKGVGRQIVMCLGEAGAKVVMNYYKNTSFTRSFHRGCTRL